MTDGTLFAGGSITKTFVAALMVKLADALGRVLSLDDRLSRWVPDFPHSREISVRQLLNHTAGTAEFASDPRFVAEEERHPGAKWTPAQTLRYASGRSGGRGGNGPTPTPTTFSPGW